MVYSPDVWISENKQMELGGKYSTVTVLCIVLFLLNEAALQQQLGDMVITSIHFGVLVLFSAVFLKGKLWLKCFWSGIAIFLVPVIYVCFMQSILLIGGFSYTEFVDKQNIYPELFTEQYLN